jgi:RNA polymerase sigma-70 factor (ECF subfamily)
MAEREEAVRGSTAREASQFATTAWSVVLRSRDRGELARPALETLCRTYWRPLYAYARRRTATPQLAEDAVQSFFIAMLEGDVLNNADPARGRFRNYLLACLSQSMARQHRRDTAAKRQPVAPLVPLDAVCAELNDPRELSPERAFDRAWALTVLENALERLRGEYERAERLERFHAFRGFLNAAAAARLDDAAKRLGLSDGATRVALHRFRQRYAEIVRDEVRATVDDEADLDAEIAALIAAVG